jgi:xanthine/CO dehydrogenase XdhC/CoxF family maturation factor
MLATTNGVVAGSISGGCVDSGAATEIAGAIERGGPKLVTFDVSHERAWEVGFACGGTIKVLVEPAVRPEILAAAAGRAAKSLPPRSKVPTWVTAPGSWKTAGSRAPSHRSFP